jgi:hypothetical protein
LRVAPSLSHGEFGSRDMTVGLPDKEEASV